LAAGTYICKITQPETGLLVEKKLIKY